jgi:succinate dehydrogenase / fumarate reductase iron-sulfur subunit
MPTTTLKIFRYQPDSGEPPYYQDFTLEHDSQITLLDAILQLQNEQDGTLAVRYSCRSAICGSCACKADGRTVLACMQQVEDLKDRKLEGEAGQQTVVVDPIGNFRPIKDLVVDLEPFWEKFKSVKPYLIPDGPPPEKERLVPKEAMQRVYKEAGCILCAACYSECNSLVADPEFVGPAALAWGYRFAGDVRDGQRKQRAKLYSGDHGIWDCTRCMYCNERCPKGVDPRDAIEKLGGVAFNEGVSWGDKGARHAKAFLFSMRTGGKLNETFLVPFTDPIGAPLDTPFALRMISKGKAPSPLPHKIKKHDEVKKLMKNVKETI